MNQGLRVRKQTNRLADTCSHSELTYKISNLLTWIDYTFFGSGKIKQKKQKNWIRGDRTGLISFFFFFCFKRLECGYNKALGIVSSSSASCRRGESSQAPSTLYFARGKESGFFFFYESKIKQELFYDSFVISDTISWLWPLFFFFFFFF